MTVILDGIFERKYLVCDTRPVGEDAAFEKGIELLDELGQTCPVGTATSDCPLRRKWP